MKGRFLCTNEYVHGYKYSQHCTVPVGTLHKHDSNILALFFVDFLVNSQPILVIIAIEKYRIRTPEPKRVYSMGSGQTPEEFKGIVTRDYTVNVNTI